MSTIAYLNGKCIHLFSEGSDLISFAPVVYNIGAALTGFLRVRENVIESLYNELIREALSIKGGKLSPEQETLILEQTAKITAQSPYLNYYTGLLSGVLFSVAKGRMHDMSAVFKLLPDADRLYEEYGQKFETDSENADAVLSPYYSKEYLGARPKQQKTLMLRSINNILFIKDAVLEDIKRKKEILSGGLELIFGNGGHADKASHFRRLLHFDARKDCFYTAGSFTVTYAPFSDEGPVNMETLSNLTEEYMEQNGINIFEVYSANWIDDLIRLEFMKSIENEVFIKRCENCGNLFAPSGRADTLYCTELYGDTGRTCAETGALKRYKDRTTQNPCHEAFNKAYKRYNSRMRNNKMTKEEFAIWLEEAKRMREACLNGELGIAEFSEWLGNKK